MQILLRLRIPKKNVEVPDVDVLSGHHEQIKSGDSSAIKQALSAKSENKESARKEGEAESASEQVKMKAVEVECEQEDRVLAVAPKSDALPFSVHVIHQAATRFHRKELGQMAKKLIGDAGEG